MLERPREHGRLARPLVWLAAVLCVGSWCGASAALDLAHVRLFAMCALAMLLVNAVWGARFLRPSISLRAQPILAASLLFLCAVLRADRLRPRSTEIDDSAKTVGVVDRLLPRSGIWRSKSVYGDRERGELEGEAQCFEVEPGSIADGERVAILSGSPPISWPRGPVPGPHATESPSQRPIEVAPDEVVRTSGASRTVGASLWKALDDLRSTLLARTDRLADAHTRGLAAAFLLGDVSKLVPGTSDLFVRTGTYHVLAISGLQVVLVAVLLVWPIAACCSWILRAASRGRVQIDAAWIRIACLALFVPLAGGGAPVVRSALAFAVGSLATLLPAALPFVRVEQEGSGGRIAERDDVRTAGSRSARGAVWMSRRADSLSLWSLALAFECVSHPLGVLTLSVQLSYAATLGLILGTGPLLQRLRALCSGGRIALVGSTGRARSPLWRVPLQRALDALLAACAGSIAAVLATLPWTWARFGEWSPVGLFATPAMVVPMASVLSLGWLWLVAPSSAIESLLDVAARSVMHLLEFCDTVPASPDPLPQRPWACVALATLLAFAALRRRPPDTKLEASKRGWIARLPLASAALLAFGVLCLPWTAAPRGLEVWALDVGNGTAVVFRAPELGTWVFDAGSRDRPGVGREALVPLLEAWEVAHVGVVLSHCDADHDGGLDDVIERFPPHTWAGALSAQLGERLAHTCRLIDVRTGEVELASPAAKSAHTSLVLGRGLDLDGNEGSRFLRIRRGSQTVTLTGDAEAEGLSAWLAMQPRADSAVLSPAPLKESAAVHEMLLLPHHGSESELLGPLLRRLSPREVWISGSGQPPVAPELARRGQPYRLTSRDGPLQITLGTSNEAARDL